MGGWQGISDKSIHGLEISKSSKSSPPFIHNRERCEEEDLVEKLFILIKTLISDNFYGKLIIRFEHGRIVLKTKVENIK